MEKLFQSRQKESISLQDALKIANKYMESAENAETTPTKLSLCDEAEKKIEYAVNIAETSKTEINIHATELANVYHRHGVLLDGLGYTVETQKSHEKAAKLGYVDLPNISGVNPDSSIGQTTCPFILAVTPEVTASLYQDVSSEGEMRSLRNSVLGRRYLVKEPSVIQFLSEGLQQNAGFKQLLHTIIEHSKNDKSLCVVASNTITILVRAGVQFNGADLRGIQI